ncbi:NAD(P)/FAD-dependent oxidoreductase [Litorisediminicola beolgyonensis]|uniref:NAD(P)/FAD-dependent oxidoreductase n=1 Tax=Litorisediminicola beolgyonensis TaxID=1173614 RepID=A0ABW3ZKP4_9RHOB
MARIDVTVRGAGIFGLACAWEMTRRGARVRVIDPGGPGAGTSGGIVGALAPHVPENWNAKKAFQLDSLLMAEAFWSEVSETGGGAPGYARTGRLQPLADADAVALARGRADSAATLWQGHARWEVTEAPGPLAPPSPTGLWVFDTLSARVHPRKACDALAAALAARGAEIVTEGAEEGAVLHATGWAGLDALSSAVGRTVGTGIKGQALLLGFAAPDAPQLFVDGLHIVLHADGTCAVGSTTERDFASPTETDAQADALLDRAVAALPELASAPVLSRWAGVRPRARSRAPMLGPWPDRPGHFIANGGFKIGFGMAPNVAQVMADLMLEGRDAVPEGFRVADNL